MNYSRVFLDFHENKKNYMKIGTLLLCCLFLIPNLLSGQEDQLFRIEISAENPHPWNHLEFKNNPENFQFAIVSDRSGGIRPGIFEDAVEKLNLLQPEFVMSVGDLIDGYLEDTTKLIAQWEEFDSLLLPLEMPFFYLPGNHDISNPVMRQLWEKRNGPRYYHFIYRNTLFITMDTNDGEGVVVGDEQVAYVNEVLERHPDVRWTFLFMHHPIWAYVPESGFSKIEEKLKGRKYTVFAGHTHQYMYSERQDANYFVLASTGGGSQLRGPKFGEFDHVTWVSMTPEAPRIVNLALKGILNATEVRDSSDYKNAQALIQTSDFRHTIFSKNGKLDWDKDTAFVLQMVVSNNGNLPLTFDGRFFHNHHLDIKQAVLTGTLPPGTFKVFNLDIRVRKKIMRQPDPLLMDWKLTYTKARKINEEPFALSGTYEIDYHKDESMLLATEGEIFLDSRKVEISSSIPEELFRFTLDGSDPDLSSPLYQGPILLDKTTTLKARRIFNDKYLGKVYEKTYEKVSPIKAPNIKKSKLGKGFAYSYYEGHFRELPDFGQLKPVKEGRAYDFDIRKLADAEDHYAIRYEGFIRIPETGIYEFMTYSDDGSRLYIGDRLVVDNNGSHSARMRNGRLAMEAGIYPLRIDYFEDYEGQVLRASVGKEGEKPGPIWDWMK